jgi:hypothetical protein
MKRFLLIIFMAGWISFPGYCWLYPEHRDIVVRAISEMDSTHRKALEKLWVLARTGHESRLCESVIDPA